MTILMNDANETNNIGYDKIALLGLFIAALLSARLVVFFKSRIAFSKPVPLFRTGLSVSMPSGNSWQSDKQWNYQENFFTISSLFPLGSDKPTTWANCRYLLSAETTTPQMRFERTASEIDAEIVETKQIQTDGITIDWARIYKPEFAFTVFYGTARLPDNRQLDIEVRHIASDGEFAEQVFRGMIKNLKFEDNELLKAGAEIVTEIKSRGLAGFLENQNSQAFFLVKDAAKRTIGFTMDVLVDSGIDSPPIGAHKTATDAKQNIQSAGLYYMRGQNSFEQATSFQCSNNLDEFIYRSELNARTGRSGIETIQNTTGEITVRKFQEQPDEKTYRLNPAAIPDIFLDQLLLQMLEIDKKEIIIDFIEADGKIIPTFIAAIEVAEDMPADDDVAYVFKLELLDGRGFSELLYLNDRKQIYKRLARLDNIYILERADAETIVREFPERAERVLRNNQMLN
jgi:hypothetical protein